MKQQYRYLETASFQQRKTKNIQHLIQSYYNSNLYNFCHQLKNCIPDIDHQTQNRFIKKNDKLWLQANLTQLYPKATQKIESLFILKNLSIKKSLDKYRATFNLISPQLMVKMADKGFQNKMEENPFIKTNKKLRGLFRSRKQSVNLSSINSEPSNNENPARQCFFSKRLFPFRQFPNHNLDIITNNLRYLHKLQQVKLQSSFTQFLFKKEKNPEEQKQICCQKRYFNKIKAATEIQCNFRTQKKFFRDHSTEENTKVNNFIGWEIKKKIQYKPKSKCKMRTTKIFPIF